eukprot:scaffold234144_cov15-Tisochrysis_lutea.AAC.1
MAHSVCVIDIARACGILQPNLFSLLLGTAQQAKAIMLSCSGKCSLQTANGCLQDNGSLARDGSACLMWQQQHILSAIACPGLAVWHCRLTLPATGSPTSTGAGEPGGQTSWAPA